MDYIYVITEFRTLIAHNWKATERLKQYFICDIIMLLAYQETGDNKPYCNTHDL